jgi:chromate transporter
MDESSVSNSSPKAASLTEVAVLFLRLGMTAFGGPAAHIAMMQQEVVERRGWMSREQFLDLLGAANLIPGPSSTELAIFIGFRLAGAAGLLLAGSCFILPAFLLVLGIAWAYVKFGHLPQVGRALYGVKPVVIAIIVQALWNLGRTAIKTRWLAALGLLALVPAFLGVSPLFLLLGAGLLVGGTRWFQDRKTTSPKALLLLASVLALFAVAPLLVRGPLAPSPKFGLFSLFCVFLKIGSVIYGSGYVLLAFLRADLVTQRGWLTSTQLLDAVSVGQVTPGPVFTTATFIGFILGGPMGAVVATAAIFLPAFLFVTLAGPFATRLRSSPLTGAFLDGVNVASLALMAAVTWQLGQSALVDPITIALAAAGLLALIRFHINSTWLIAAGIVIGIASGH